MTSCFKIFFSTIILILLAACGPAKTPEQEAADFEEARTAVMGAIVERQQMYQAMSKTEPQHNASGPGAKTPAP